MWMMDVWRKKKERKNNVATEATSELKERSWWLEIEASSKVDVFSIADTLIVRLS